MSTEDLQADSPMPPTAVPTRRGARRAYGLHPWIYESDVAEVRDAAGGDIVRVEGPRGRSFGHAMYSDHSKIRLRLLGTDGPWPDEEFWRRRLRAAVAYRDSLGIEGDAYRLVHSEADQLPSIVVDRYGEYLVIQSSSQGADKLQPLLVRLLVEELGPAGVLARNDLKVRAFEGLEQRVDVVHGEIPERVQIHDGTVRMELDLVHGQKTGFFLDQRENREAAARYAHGDLLDCFSYQGAFAVRLGGACDSIVAVEISPDAAPAIRRNAELNGLDIQVRSTNTFDHLRELESAGARFDTIVLDPPAFAKNRKSVASATAGYKEINLRAMKLLRPGGHLVTCSCSYHVDQAMFVEILTAAAHDVGAGMTLVERRGQSRDHPVRVGLPEGNYLKCLILRRVM